MLIKVKTLTGKEVSRQLPCFTYNYPYTSNVGIGCRFLYVYLLCVFDSSVQIEIDIEPTDRVERIKERVEEKEGIPPQQQRLIFSGKQM